MSRLTDIHIDQSKLKAAREARGLLQSWVAEQIGVSKQSMWAYENDACSIPSDALARLCKLYGIELADITAEVEAA